MDIHVLRIWVFNYPCFYRYPFGYPWISVDIHELTCYGFSIPGNWCTQSVLFPITYRQKNWLSAGQLWICISVSVSYASTIPSTIQNTQEFWRRPVMLSPIFFYRGSKTRLICFCWQRLELPSCPWLFWSMENHSSGMLAVHTMAVSWLPSGKSSS